MLFVSYFVALVAGLFATVSAAPSYCDNLTVQPCMVGDIMFLLDGSNSMNVDHFYGSLLNYTLAIFCAFDDTEPNRAGLILFNARVEVIIPFAVYTRTQWYAKVYEIKASRFGPNPACCSCCTPTADAFELAGQIFDANTRKPTQVAFVLTDGVPSNNNANTGGNPTWWWFNPQTGFDPAVYNAQSVPQMSTKLKNDGVRVVLVGVPDRDNIAPDIKYFDGGYPNGHNLCITRQSVKFCSKYYTVDPPNFPLVSEPVALNSFSIASWDDEFQIDGIIEDFCVPEPTKSPTRLPTTTSAPTTTPRPTLFPTTAQPTKLPTSQSPTSQAPTKLPTTQFPTSQTPTKLPTMMPTTLAPTSNAPTQLPSLAPTGVFLEQIDLTFLVDRSNSMTYYPGLCQSVLNTFPRLSAESLVPCWELWIKYMMDQIADFVAIPAGPQKNRPLGWASDFPADGSMPAKGLRVNIYGFACANNQRTPLQFDYTADINGGPITSQEQLIEVMNVLLTTVTPFGGTCPALAVEQAIKQLETTNVNQYPLQTVILMTDGVFYDGDATPRATQGLREYKALTFAIGVAVAIGDSHYGLTPEEIETQRKQLSAFVNDDPQYFYNIRNGWDGLLEITDIIASSLPQYFFSQGGNPIPRYTWCGFRRIRNCKSSNWRMQNCKWTGKRGGQYLCKKV